MGSSSFKRRRSLRRLVGLGLLLGLAYTGFRSRARRARQARPQPPVLDVGRLLVMAHQGGAGKWPSNTLLAFQKSAELGVDALELDVHLTADGAIVVRHDPVVDTTTDGLDEIRGLTLSQIKSLDAGYTWTADGGLTYPFRRQGITIPTLEEVLQSFPQTRINIDIKPDDPEVIEPFCRLLEMYNCLERVIVGSFHDAQMERFRAALPRVAAAASPSQVTLFYALSTLAIPDTYFPQADVFQIPEYRRGLHVVTPRFVHHAHAQGLPVHVWTVNEPGDMQRLIGWGVDGIFSDHPDVLMAAASRETGA